MSANKAAVPVTQAEVMDAAIGEARAWWTAHEGHHDLSNMTAEELYGIATAAHFAGIQWILGGPWYGNAAPAYQSRDDLKLALKNLLRAVDACNMLPGHALDAICDDSLAFARAALSKASAA